MIATVGSVQCFQCKKDTGLTPGAKVVRSEECPHCYASIHCCKMCQFYDVKSYNECRESNTDRIVDKEKANYCDYFILTGGDGSQGDSKDSLVDAANALFKD